MPGSSKIVPAGSRRASIDHTAGGSPTDSLPPTAQHEALREHLLNQAAAAAADDHADGQFLLACRGARQKQRRERWQGDEQDETDGAEAAPAERCAASPTSALRGEEHRGGVVGRFRPETPR